MSLTDEGHYGPKQLNMLKTIWGEGNLSPGGTDEIDEILGDYDLSGKIVLDIGCGCGGAAFHMIEERNAGHVIGFDTEPLVIERANKLAKEKKISSQVKFKCIPPGPLQFENETIDVVFSKEVFFDHYPDIVTPYFGPCTSISDAKMTETFLYHALDGIFFDARFKTVYIRACFEGATFYIKNDLIKNLNSVLRFPE